ncbi:redox-sensing transcriptional repressor Rex [Arthrobacter gengyunqii]|uniref:Redox-sensing transcriptional repressor Rex n=1 Tax=Arthrobacter gengyunqii TaxID=2886940 RepID=A0A9X1S5T8_9MICC|nr:redox-sensing transcriptional repressor Rex [Arthrobacter gengyunqii]MCC3265657.1 redox-sensing transcriptional repressor Rex [Arthrobacter gengyunqii]MCC3268391.1 redox-sensing transcriptional repressor Rex [Arthrobacter gengyunqii]UOY95785.1 redox-sensing transcriptional repressor Rex [Arthrobacter gengyunqii]
MSTSEEPAPAGVVHRHIPPASLARLTIYLRALGALLADGVERVSSDELAEAAGVNSPKLRKDLSYLGSYGTRGVGYEVSYLSDQISAALGLTRNWRVAIVGAGHLGKALAGYPGFGSRGFEVVALLDADQMVIGQEVGWLRVSPVKDLEGVVQRTRANMAVLSVPADVAQELCDRLIESGITSILSFAPVVLQVPDHVQLRKVDMATELQILAYHAQRAQASEIAAKARARLGT